MTVVRWELLPEEEVTVRLEVKKTLPNADGSWNPDIIYNSERPEEVVSMKAQGMSLTEKEAEKTKARTPNTDFAFTITRGTDTFTYTGRVIGVAARPVGGTQYWEVTVKLHRTDV